MGPTRRLQKWKKKKGRWADQTPETTPEAAVPESHIPPKAGVVNIICQPTVLSQVRSTFPKAPPIKVESPEPPEVYILPDDLPPKPPIKYKYRSRKKYRGWCTHCQKNFLFLFSHLVAVHGERPYKCGQCPKSFKRQHLLDQHQVIHTREWPYYCLQCRKGFGRGIEFRAHLRFHRGEKKPYGCEECAKRFTRKFGLKRHYENFHGNKGSDVVVKVEDSIFL